MSNVRPCKHVYLLQNILKDETDNIDLGISDYLSIYQKIFSKYRIRSINIKKTNCSNMLAVIRLPFPLFYSKWELF